MAVYQFSALSDGQAISFNPNTDVLNFDQSAISGADIRVTISGTSTRIEYGSKDILLLNTTPQQLATTNVTFANGSRILLGDNTTSTAADNSANSLTGTSGNDLLNGYGGADTLNGGLGNDVYFVQAGDVIVNDTGGIDTVYSESSWSFAQGSGLENLTLIGTAGLANGNELNNVITGNSSANSINGRAGDDTMYGMAGNDSFLMSTGGTSTYGNDFVDGGTGVDTIEFGSNARSALVVSLAAGTATGGGDGGTGSITFVNVENVVGGNFADQLTGDAAANFLFGGAANDTLDGGAGADRLEGGLGSDNYVFSVAPSSASADTIVGFVSGADKIVLHAAVHANLGAAGNFSTGDERFHAGTAAAESDDRVIYNAATGQLWYDADGVGGAAAQLIATLNAMPALAATDIVVAGGAPSAINGTEGNDSLVGTAGNDAINGFGGNDTLDGGAGADTLDGGQGNDLYRVTAGDVLVDAGGIDTVVTSGNWTLAGGFEDLILDANGATTPWPHGEGNELANVMQSIGTSSVSLFGLGGDDQLISGTAGDNLAGGAGNDTLHGNGGNDDLRGGSGSDWMEGGDGNDNLAGWHGNDTLLGGRGSDHFDMSPEFASGTTSFGNDVIDGGEGFDWVDFRSASASAVTVNLANGTAAHAQGTASLTSIEGVIGGYGNDTIRGDDVGNYLYGWDGGDVLYGNGGQDTLDGGAGADEFMFNMRPVWWNGDIIEGFAPAQDKLVFDLAAYARLGLAGNFSANDARFYAAPGAYSAHDADDRLIYNTTYGYLYYDPDGTGDRPAEYVATLNLAPALSATDIRVIGTAPTGGTLTGTEGNDSLEGTDAPDTILGLGGNDSIHAYDEDDSVAGGAGDDWVRGWHGADTLDGGSGNDTIYGNEGDDSLLGGDGDDWLYTDDGADTAHGGAGNDYIVAPWDWWEDDGTPQNFSGDEGHDTLYGGLGDDVLAGGDGNDYLWGREGADTFEGGLGNDTMAVGPQWSGNEWTTNTNAVISDAGGVDTVIAIHQDWTLGAGLEHLVLQPLDYDYGDAGDRVLIGNSLDNEIDGSWAASAHVEGGAGNDTLLGGRGAWWGSGEEASNWLDGGVGNDVLKGSYGQDTAFGGSGNDYLETYYNSDVLDGGLGNDTLVGGDSTEWRPGGDLFRFSVAPGAGNADRIVDFLSGDDKIELVNTAHAGIGTSGNFAADDERFHAAAGATGGAETDDRVIYDMSTGNLYYDADGSGTGAAVLIATLQNAPTLLASDIIVTGEPIAGSADNDFIVGTPAADTIDGGAGNDTVTALGGNDIVAGGAGHDSLGGGDGRDHITGGDGNDTLDGGLHTDTMDGGLGDDTYYADAEDALSDAGGVDHVIAWSWTLGDGFENLTVNSYGGRGQGNSLNNVLRGIADYSVLYGRAGDDTLEAAGGYLDGGEGSDFLRLSTSYGTLVGGDGNDSLVGADGGDALYGSRGNDTMGGGAGNDTFYMYNASSAEGPAYGQDQMDGGDGLDWVRFDWGFGRTTGIAIDLAAGTLSGGGASGDGATLVSVESVVGSEFNDSILGSAAANELYGYSGDDRLDGRAGNDTLSGNEGADVLLFTAAPGGANADVVLGFVSGTDKIHLDATLMPALGVSGAMVAGDERFHAGTAAAEADDRVLYNTANGQLFYDADGSGAGAAQLIATLSGAPALAATDIVIENGAPAGAVNLTGTAGNDSLTGTAGNDTLSGLAGNDTLRGLDGNDVLDGGDGIDSLDGGLGDDRYYVTAGDVLVADPGGIDTLYTSVTWNFSPTTIDNAVVTGTANVNIDGNALSNHITGNDAANTINARAGSDTVIGGGGNDYFLMSMGGTSSFGIDWIDGGLGVDTVDYGANPKSALVVDLAAGTVSGGEAGGGGSATLLNIEKFIASPYDDRVSGTGASNTFWGQAGNDTVLGLAGIDSISGGDGNDWLDGGAGFDTLSGGNGSDSFVFTVTPGSANADRISDYVVADDQLVFENAVFTALGATTGTWAAGDGRFRAAAGATSGADSNDRIIYNTTNGNLYYDPDGSGAQASQLVATIANVASLTSADIAVI